MLGALAGLLALAVRAADADNAKASTTSTLGVDAAKSHGHEDGHEGGHGSHTLHGEEPKGLLGKGTEFLYVSPQLFIWTLLIFVPCVFIMKKAAWEPYLASLQNREHKIAESLRLAEDAKLEAGRLIAEHDAYKTKAFGSIREAIDQMEAQATKECDRILAEAKDTSAKELEAAKAEIEAARLEALGELKNSSAKLAASMAGKLAKRPFDAAKFDSAIEEVRS